MSFEARIDLLATEDTLADFLLAFERGTWPKSSWNHAAHIAVAGCYFLAHPGDVAEAGSASEFAITTTVRAPSTAITADTTRH